MTRAQQWLEIIIKIDPENLETISNYIFALGCDGIHERTGDIVVYFRTDLWHAEKLIALRDYLHKTVAGFENAAIEINDVPGADWNESWKESFKPFRVGDQIVIVPDWEKYDAGPDEIKIVITPKMAFGTGHHETTRLMMGLLRRYVSRNMRVLDAGTGSGILAILSAKLGASAIVAFDTDPLAVENTRENCALNGVADTIDCIEGTIDAVQSQQFDLISANINRNVLTELAGKFERLLCEDGLLLLSGLLVTDETEVLDHYKKTGWQRIQSERENEWLALVLKHE